MAVALISVIAGLAQADTITVGPGPGYDFNTIQAGIDAAGEGETVIVDRGTYYENIHFNEPNITLTSTDPNDSTVVEQTIIYGGGLGSVVTFPRRGSANSELLGFTITGGNSILGGGILGYGTKATIGQCIIRENSGVGLKGCFGTIRHCIISSNGGGLVDCHGLITHCTITGNSGGGLSRCNGQINNCIISANSTSGHGAGVSDCGGLISNCIISNNSTGNWGAGGIHCGYNSNPTIRNCLITGNTGGYGGGINCNTSSPMKITNCTIADNTASEGGGICNYGGNPIVTNCILWGNTAARGDQIIVYGLGGSTTVRYSDIQGGWSGVGNIDADPCFALSTDYHIMPGSPCIDAGDPNYIAGPNETDLDGNPRILDGDGDGNNVVDMGAYEYNSNSPFIAVSAVDFYFVQDWPRREPQTLLIRNCGGQPLYWQIIEDCNWLEVTPPNGVSTNQINEVTITVDPNGLAPGLYDYTLEALDPNASNSPVSILVTMPVGLILPVPSGDYPTIQAAIDAAADYDVVLVSDGNYTGDGNRDIDFLGKAITVKSENGPNNCIIDCNCSWGYRRGFYFHNMEGSDSVLDGFTIINGLYLYGGAIYCEKSSPTITNCIMRGNLAWGGGGISYGYDNDDGYRVSATVSNCTISNNTGGGIYSRVKGMLTITNCTISDNTGEHVGGIYCDYCSAEINNCTITGNINQRDAGGGIYCGGPSLTVFNSVISDNTTAVEHTVFPCGGGISCRGCLTISNCVINNNTAKGTFDVRGGGIFCDGWKATITNCTISGNSAGYYGGGIYGEGSEATITNCTIAGNSSAYRGGGIYSKYSKATITNCTIAGNSADDIGGAICSIGLPKINNCILWGNSAPEIRGRVAVSYSDIKGGWDGPGNIDADPCFVQPGYWVDANDPNIIVEPNDPNAVWIEGDYHLLPSSPCIDTGDPNYIPEPNETDLDGNPRVIGDYIDMGAYEANYIEAEMNFTPKIINCNSKGNYVKAHFTLPDGFWPEDVDINEPAWAEPIDLESEYIKPLGSNPVKLEICFDRQDFCDAITKPGQIELTIIGSFVTGQNFYATDTITLKSTR